MEPVKRQRYRLDCHVGSIDWRKDIYCAAKPPHVEKITRTSGAGILVAGHRSVLSWQISLEENSRAWANLIVEGLIANGDSGYFVRKIPMTSYRAASSPRCPKPDFMSLVKVAGIEDRVEEVVKAALSGMRK